MANIITGIRIICSIALLFCPVFPLTVSLIDLKYSGALVSAVATFAAIQEGHYIRTGRCDEEQKKLRKLNEVDGGSDVS